GSESAVVLNVDVLAAEAELVLALVPVDVLCYLADVLRTAERNGVPGSELRITGKREKEFFLGRSDFSEAATIQVRRRTNRLVAERLQVVKAVVSDLALRNQIRCECARDRDQDVIVEVGLAGIEPCIRTVIDRARELILVIQRVAAIDLSPLAQIPVN